MEWWLGVGLRGRNSVDKKVINFRSRFAPFNASNGKMKTKCFFFIIEIIPHNLQTFKGLNFVIFFIVLRNSKLTAKNFENFLIRL